MTPQPARQSQRSVCRRAAEFKHKAVPPGGTLTVSQLAQRQHGLNLGSTIQKTTVDESSLEHSSGKEGMRTTLLAPSRQR